MILAALEEPPDYADDSRGATIAQLILTELGRLRHQSLTVPMPRDPRALRVARPLLGNARSISTSTAGPNRPARAAARWRGYSAAKPA